MAMTRRTGGLFIFSASSIPCTWNGVRASSAGKPSALSLSAPLTSASGEFERGDEAFHALASSRRNSCTSWMETVGRNLANSRNSRAKKPSGARIRSQSAGLLWYRRNMLGR